jgi:glycosyltransferase involved in cell wall biosynthesis
MRVAWFSPLPPSTSGIAAYTAEVTPLLAPHFRVIDLYGERVPAGAEGCEWVRAGAVRPASEFVYRHRRQPYDLIVYQFGNSSAHDYMWAYAFRYPGLLVLHDAQLHQARALQLLRRLEPRLDDYLAEIRAGHPDAPADIGYLFAAGLGGSLFRLWPHVSLLIAASRMTLVHSAHLATQLRRAHPDARIRHLEMGTADPLADAATARAAGQAIRRAHGIPDTAMVVGAYGGLTPEKRLPALLEALADRPTLHALLVGARAAHYDVAADIRGHGLAGRVHVTGYVEDADLPAHLAAADVCWCLRWPSNGETSASWLRCLGAGRPTIVTALAQLADVPTLAMTPDGSALDVVSAGAAAVGVAIDPVDEAREVRVALAALDEDAALRARLGAAARAFWKAHHTLPRMAEGYRRHLEEAARAATPAPPLPPHLLDEGMGTLRRLLAETGTPAPW